MHKRMLAVACAVIFLLAVGAITYAAPHGRGGFFGVLQWKVEQILGIVTGTDTAVQGIASRLDDPDHGLAEIKDEIRNIEQSATGLPEVRAVRFVFTTNESTTSISNVDVAGGLPFLTVKRYTVTINTANLSTMPPGIGTLQLVTGALDEGNTAHETQVAAEDLSSLAPLPRPGVTFPPFAGTVTFVRIIRGADGLGPVDVVVNAYVEIAQ